MTGGGHELVHGAAVALAGRAALIRGASGAGKSDLALRCLAVAPSALIPKQALLVADDQVRLEPRDGAIRISSPATIAGQIEVRGVGIIRVPSAPEATLVLVVDLVRGVPIERLPDGQRRATLCGAALPSLELDPFESSAPVKLLLALWSFVTNDGENALRP